MDEDETVDVAGPGREGRIGAASFVAPRISLRNANQAFQPWGMIWGKSCVSYCFNYIIGGEAGIRTLGAR